MKIRSADVLSVILPLLSALGLGLLPAESADISAYQKGVALYGQKSYRAAADEFERQLRTTPSDVNTLYYCALCHQYCNNRARAKQLYDYVAQNFKGTRQAELAGQALGQLAVLGASVGGTQPGSASGSSSGSPASGSPALPNVPDEVRVPFEKHGNDVIVQVQVNGRAVSFVLDTGAASVVVGQNHLQEWGILKAQGRDQFETSGVGEGKTKAWHQKLDLKLGQIYMRDFPVTVQDNLPTEPLLGQTFLKYFNVKIDDESRSVSLAKKGTSAAQRVAARKAGAKEVPFQRGSGGHMIVDAKVCGKPFSMIFDTGAESTCFSAADWKKLGFEIPGDARRGISRGVQGDAVHWTFTIDSLKVGPLTREYFPVSVIESGKSIPLLGMDFYGHMKYAIDSSRNVIVFTEE